MRKKDYLAELSRLNRIQHDAVAAAAKLQLEFKQACPHPKKNLIIRENVPEDEFGKKQFTWKTYIGTCSRCGGRVESSTGYSSTAEWQGAISLKLSTRSFL